MSKLAIISIILIVVIAIALIVYVIELDKKKQLKQLKEWLLLAVISSRKRTWRWYRSNKIKICL